MSHSHHPADSEPARERLFDLLADRSVQPLTDAETLELNQLLQQFQDVDELEFELAAASLTLAFEQPASHVPLPADLAAKIAQDARSFFSTQASNQSAASDRAENKIETDKQSAIVKKQQSSFSMREAIAWLVAAAAVLFAVGVFDRPKVQPTEKQQMAELEETATDVIDLPWQKLKDPSAVEATGKVVWSTERQKVS